MLEPARIVDALRSAEAEGSVFHVEPGLLSGFSGEKLVGALQRIAAVLPPRESCYLEVGVFQGLTLLSVAASRPELDCVGIDNFSQFDLDGRNREIFEHRRSRLGITNVRLIDRDYEAALEDRMLDLGGRRIGLYFVDGPHDYRAQRMCLDLVLPFLAEDAVIVVDDCNYAHVRQANRDFLVSQPDFRLLFEAYTRCHPSNMAPSEERQSRQGWWNGVNILIRDPRRRLAPLWPPIDSNRKLYENDHLIHASNIGEATPELIDLVQPIFHSPSPRNFGRALRAIGRLCRHWWRLRRRPRYRAANTFSSELPASRVHPQVLERAADES